MDRAVVIALQGLALAKKLGGQIKDSHVDEDIKRLEAAVQTIVPAKPDGTPYTTAELHTAAENARAPWEDVKDQTGG